MAYSSVSYSANSAANSGKDYTYSFPAVAHDTANILVTVGGTALAITRYTVASSGGTITLEAAPGAGTAPIDAVLSASNVLKVYRFTNRTSAEVVFSSTAIIQDEDLNTATDQGRYLALEAVDRANESIAIDETDSTRYNIQVEGVDKRIFGIATPTDDKDAVNKAYSDANVSISNDNKLTAISYATRTDGNAQTYSEGAGSDTSDESAKNWAVGDHASNAPTEGSSKEWSLGGQGTSANTADGSEYAAKEYAQGQTATGGTAKQWALGGGAFVEGTPVTGSSYSAKKHATDSASSASDASGSETAAAASQVAAANSAAAVSAVYDDFADKYLGQMADGATATSGTANGTWAKNSSSITLASTSGTIEVGQLVAGTGIPAGANILSIDGSTIVITNSMAALGSAVALTFTGHGIYGAYNVAKDGPPTDNDNGTLATGMLYFNSTDNEMRIYDGGNWIAASAAGTASLTTYKFVATAAQTTFTGVETQAPSASLSYSVLNLIVFLNGVRLDASDYTATNGTSIVLGSGAALSDELVVVAFKSFSVSTVEGTSIKSTGESDETKFLRVDGAGASWQPVALKADKAAPVFTTSITITGGTEPTGSAGMMYYDSTINYLRIHNGTAWANVRMIGFTNALGGNIIQTIGSYNYHVFTSSGTFTTKDVSSIDYFMIGGGGGGGSQNGGGGGAGGVRTATALSVPAATYAITNGVPTGTYGLGGLNSETDATHLGQNGATSTIGSLAVALGGGGGGAYAGTSGKRSALYTDAVGSGGGSGGGPTQDGSFPMIGGIATKDGGTFGTATNQGFDGGDGADTATYASGGGGGASAEGGDGVASVRVGDGGNGVKAIWGLSDSETNTILTALGIGHNTGGFRWFGGGGGGATGPQPKGDGGNGGGGDGSPSSTVVGVAGASNTGGGGGGGYNSNGGLGGSGIVIIRYAI